MPSLHIEKISLSSFKATLSRYTDTAPSALSELDTLRYDTIPAKLAKIKKDASLQKSDIERLVEWKLYVNILIILLLCDPRACLNQSVWCRSAITDANSNLRKHGTYRPALMGLVKQNPADLVKSTTQEAFASFAESKDAMTALKILTRLRGIGPATASLLLSVYQPDTVPFFSDELFRWTHWDGTGKTGWGRSIKYNVTEYKEILAIVEQLRKRLDVAAVDVEKVAYVLGKEGVDVEVNEGNGEEVEDDIVGKKIKENTEKESKISEAAAEAASNMDSEKTKEDFLNGSFKERDKRQKAANKKTEERDEEDGAVMGKEKHPEEETLKDTEKKGTKRKARDEKVPAEGTRRSTRRKA